MMLYTIRPLGPWLEGDTSDRRSSAVFRATWQETLKLLGRELELLEARQVVMQIDLCEGALRIDGMPRAAAKIGHPGVRIAFGSKHGPLTYATDVYEQQWAGTMPGWKANVRAIALGLEALRAVDRYGVTRRGEQYTGWKQLGAGTSTAVNGAMTHSQAVDLVNRHCTRHSNGVPFEDRTAEGLARCWRSARAATHPDRAGDSAECLRLEQAGRTLGLVT